MIHRDTTPARPVRAWLLGAAVTAVCLVPAVPATAAELQVSVNGNPVIVSIGSGDADVSPPVLTTSKSASGTDRQSRGGVSARKLVAMAGVAIASFTTMQVGSATLEAREVQNGFTGDPLGTRQATFDPGGSGVSFFRPMRDENDLNADDRVENVTSVSLSTTGHARQVTINADRAQVEAGQAVNFTSSAGGGASLSYFWQFGDGQESNAASVSHVYRSAGSYEAQLTVVGSDGSSGVAITRIQVGGQQPGGTSNTPAAPRAPSRGGGGRAAGGGRASTGGGSGDDGASSGPSRSRGRGDGGDGGATGTGGGTGGGAGAGTGGSGGGEAASSEPAPASSGRTPARSQRKREEEKTAAEPGGKPVSGVLLEGTSAFQRTLLSPLGPGEQEAQRKVRAAAGTPPGVLVWLAAGALCVMLLLAGAARETQRASLQPEPQPT